MHLLSPIIFVLILFFLAGQNCIPQNPQNLPLQFTSGDTDRSSTHGMREDPQDPLGWREFRWEMSKDYTRELGAKPFKDGKGKNRFGLEDIELVPGDHFWVDLGFYSHIGLASVLVQMKAHTRCANETYEILLKELRGKYGQEKEAKDLDYPSAIYLSHVWAIGLTKIELHHTCSKPDRAISSNRSFLIQLRLERRYAL